MYMCVTTMVVKMISQKVDVVIDPTLACGLLIISISSLMCLDVKGFFFCTYLKENLNFILFNKSHFFLTLFSTSSDFD